MGRQGTGKSRAGNHTSVDPLVRDLHRARADVIRLLARRGPVDRDQLHRLIEAVDRYGQLKSRRFEEHIVALRELLGDEKGSRFFSLLLRHMESKRGRSHR